MTTIHYDIHLNVTDSHWSPLMLKQSIIVKKMYLNEGLEHSLVRTDALCRLAFNAYCCRSIVLTPLENLSTSSGHH
jgi:DNA-directed RNA polymerase subunit N (RpoN/RPB10)